MKKALAKRLVDSGIGYQCLNNLLEARGEKGLLAILFLTNKSITYDAKEKRASGTTDPFALNLIQDHFKTQPH